MSKTFNAGPSAMEALLAGAIDATYVGPGPATNAFIKSEGALRIVAGGTSGGNVRSIMKLAAGGGALIRPENDQRSILRSH